MGINQADNCLYQDLSPSHILLARDLPTWPSIPRPHAEPSEPGGERM